MYAQVVLSRVSSNIDRIYSYLIPGEMKIEVGSQVLISFGPRKTVGYVVGISESFPENVKNIKPILEVRGDIPVFNEVTLKLAKWISDYYMCMFGTALRAVMPPGIDQYERVGGKKRISSEGASSPQQAASSQGPVGSRRSTVDGKKIQDLNEEQKKCFDQIVNKIEDGKPSTTLLYGNAGNGKIKIYIALIRHLLALGKSIVILFPEIRSADPVIEEIKLLFGSEVAVLHSSADEIDLVAEWIRIYKGQARIVLGTRSALFSPVKDPGLIVIDQEEEFTYKQEQNPKYHTRETAIKLAELLRIPVVLSSGCPSVESYYFAQTGKYSLSVLKDAAAGTPEIFLVDMRSDERIGSGIFSKKLFAEIEGSLSDRKKVILFINRRGYSPFMVCRQCGSTVECPNCSVSLSYHSQDKSMHCHRCGYASSVPLVCSNCMSSLIKFMGSGTQKIESETAKYFSGISTVRIDSDSTPGKGSRNIAIKAFAEGSAEILIGTQMAAHALEYVKAGVVGIISADSALKSPDFRSAESTMQTLFDLFGISKACNIPEKIVLQTYNPGHYAIRSAINFDYQGFYDKEIGYRKESGYPPFGSIIGIAVASADGNNAEVVAKQLCEKIRAMGHAVSVLGPAQTALAKVRGLSRWQILIKGKDLDIIKAELKRIIAGYQRTVRISVDVDPISIT